MKFKNFLGATALSAVMAAGTAYAETTIRVQSVLGDSSDEVVMLKEFAKDCLLYTSPSPRDGLLSRMPSSA